MKPLIVRTLTSGYWACDEPNAQRMSLERERGTLPVGVEVSTRSTCNSRCVNPDHLRLDGEPEQARPTGRPISEHDKQRIRRIYQSTLSVGLLADVMDCELEYIKDVKRGLFPAITDGLKLGSGPAVKKKTRVYKPKKPVDTWPYEGEQKTAGELAKIAGCQTLTMKSRLRRMTAEEAVAFKFKATMGCPGDDPTLPPMREPDVEAPKAKTMEPKVKGPRIINRHRPPPKEGDKRLGCVRHDVGGEMLTVLEMAHRAGISKASMYSRLKTMTPEQAMKAPTKKNGKPIEPAPLYPWNGEMLTARQLAPKSVVSYFTLYSRLSVGWSLDEAMTTPVHGKRLSQTARGSSSSE